MSINTLKMLGLKYGLDSILKWWRTKKGYYIQGFENLKKVTYLFTIDKNDNELVYRKEEDGKYVLL